MEEHVRQKLTMLVNNHKLRMEEDVREEDKLMHEVNSLRSLYVALALLLEKEQ